LGVESPPTFDCSKEIVMTKFFSRFARNDSGATAVEYGLIAALIGVVIIAGAGALGVALNQKFTDVGTTVTNAGS
jgi:pilus assembly protein Flp/PilA